MEKKIKAAFDNIQAEENLKTSTIMFLHKQTGKRSKFRGFTYAAVSAAVFAIAAGAFSYNVYFTESAYLDLEVNPSVEIVLNRFDRIIGTYAYNSDGESILEDVNIRHKNYKTGVEIIIGAMAQRGFTQDVQLVSITLQANDKARESEMLLNAEAAVRAQHEAASVNAFPVDGDTRTAAHDVNLSPAKYLAILELREVDPTATIEACRNHSIVEIKRMTEDHLFNHHGEQDYGRKDMENETPDEGEQNSPGNGKTHHGGQGHRGHN